MYRLQLLQHGTAKRFSSPKAQPKLACKSAASALLASCGCGGCAGCAFGVSGSTNVPLSGGQNQQINKDRGRLLFLHVSMLHRTDLNEEHTESETTNKTHGCGSTIGTPNGLPHIKPNDSFSLAPAH